MKTQKRSAFDALCEQHYELLNEHGPFGWGTIAIEVAQDEQNVLLSQRDALVEALEAFVKWSEEKPIRQSLCGGDLLITARAAIAKAKGETL